MDWAEVCGVAPWDMPGPGAPAAPWPAAGAAGRAYLKMGVKAFNAWCAKTRAPRAAVKAMRAARRRDKNKMYARRGRARRRGAPGS